MICYCFSNPHCKIFLNIPDFGENFNFFKYGHNFFLAKLEIEIPILLFLFIACFDMETPKTIKKFIYQNVLFHREFDAAKRNLLFFCN